jgi:hypothetical protein
VHGRSRCRSTCIVDVSAGEDLARGTRARPCRGCLRLTTGRIIADAIMRTTNRKPPLGFYQMGPSFRRETRWRDRCEASI